jgi:hypothetical protein
MDSKGDGMDNNPAEATGSTGDMPDNANDMNGTTSNANEMPDEADDRGAEDSNADLYSSDFREVNREEVDAWVKRQRAASAPGGSSGDGDVPTKNEDVPKEDNARLSETADSEATAIDPPSPPPELSDEQRIFDTVIRDRGAKRLANEEVAHVELYNRMQAEIKATQACREAHGACGAHGACEAHEAHGTVVRTSLVQDASKS